MVQGLAFLSKKSWHTKNLANQEKVWMAEQRKAAEESKTKELAKQIQQEREEEELDKIAGRKSVRRDRGIDWMYEGGAAAAKEAQLQKNEEYLMGKEFVPEERATGDFAVALEHGGRVNSIVESASVSNTTEEEKKPAAVPAPTGNEEPSVADRNEAFRMRHEDPMFLVSQTEREKQTQQDKKRALYERVVGPTEDKNPISSDERRRSRKEKKRERKYRRHEEGRRSDDHNRRHARSRSRSRSPSRDRAHKKRRKRRHMSRSPSEDRKRSRSPERHYNDRHDSRRRERSRSRSYEREERRRNRRRGSPNGDYGGRHRYEREACINERMPSPPRYHEQERHREDDRSSRLEGFGLQGTSSSVRTDYLGPNRQLLEEKRQQRDLERRRKRDTASTRRRMTDEERDAALQAMERDASKRHELLHQKRRHNQEDEHAAPSSGNASFLQDMAEKTHGIREQGGSLASRVAQSRHTNQKLSEDFL